MSKLSLKVITLQNSGTKYCCRGYILSLPMGIAPLTLCGFLGG